MAPTHHAMRVNRLVLRRIAGESPELGGGSLESGTSRNCCPVEGLYPGRNLPFTGSTNWLSMKFCSLCMAEVEEEEEDMLPLLLN